MTTTALMVGLQYRVARSLLRVADPELVHVMVGVQYRVARSLLRLADPELVHVMIGL